MTHWVRTLATKADNLGSILGAHIVDEENLLVEVVFLTSTSKACMYACM